MTITEIETYLAIKHSSLDDSIGEEIEQLRKDAISQQNEERANYCWCLKQIYHLQKGFISAVNSLKLKNYEDAWCMFDRVDIGLSNLENNFDTSQGNDRYHLLFIARMIKEYQKLFPYCHFLSRECIIKAEECTICGKPVSLRKPCGHKVGKLHMGELCLRKVTDIELKALCVVTDPFDKYTFLQIPDHEYNYGMLEELMREIDDPYDEFSIETIKVIKPEFKSVGRNELCPCGSGKKYKKCHLRTAEELMDHHIVHMSKPIACADKYVGTFGTWK